MSNTWGKGSVNNNIGWGQAAGSATNNWGESQKTSWAGQTDIVGVTPVSIAYSSSAFCADASDPTPTISNNAGVGTFSSTAGLVFISTTTGEVDLDASTAGATYVITYTDTDAATATFSLTINDLDNAAFAYSASSYTTADADPTPTITGLTGGTFSAGSGLVFVDSGTNTGSSTGEIDLSASTIASYTVTYSTSSSGSSVCPNTSTFSLAVTASFTGLLDTYTGSEAAYSLRRLSSSYTGNLIRVTKKVSNVISTTDIGYNSSNELDTTALATFASGADNGEVRVDIWYDQSGNGNNVTQSSFTSCPYIYQSGSLKTSNGKPAFQTNTNVWLQTSNQPLSSTQQSGFMVAEPITIGSFDSIFGHGDYRSFFWFANPQIGVQMVGINKAVSNVGNFAVGNQSLISYYNNSSTFFLRQDGSQLGSTSVTPASYGNKDILIGQYWTGTANGNINKIFKGYNQEQIIFPSEQSSNMSGIETNINNYYTIY